MFSPFLVKRRDMFPFLKAPSPFSGKKPVLSDHCFIDFNFVYRNIVIQPLTTTTSSRNFNGANYKYTWDSNCKDEFVENLSSEDVRNETDTDINVYVSELSGIIHNVASPLFKRNMLPKQNDDIDNNYK